MPVLDIRGTHGSGKSYIVHSLLARYGNEKIMVGGSLLGHLLPGLACAVVGPYTTACGGCDAVKTQDEVVRRVRLFAGRYPNVLLEGSLVGHTYGRYAALAAELEDYTFLFLNTPLRNCIARVTARRLARGNAKPLDPKNIVRDHHTTQTKLPARFAAAGYNVIRLDWRNAVAGVLQAMGVEL